MKDRLIRFMQSMDISSGQLADRIGVQRSGISHLLSGRNKPSYDFIQKLLHAFPSVNAEWLITGNGPMMKTGQQPGLFSDTDENPPKPVAASGEKSLSFASEGTSTASKPVKQGIPEGNREILHVMVFYTDGTFEMYKPGK
ncbi:MAG: helix-turn-helix transcriptional regulator [Chlorobi bacterium]|nr:helix-turn-helix transcriptional regulator [Chlorobiota bacterium]